MSEDSEQAREGSSGEVGTDVEAAGPVATRPVAAGPAEASAAEGDVGVQAASPDAGYAPSDETRRMTGVRVLLVLGAALAVLMVVFGRSTSKNYQRYDSYHKATLEDPEHPPRWETEALTVDGCVDEVLDWVESCPGVSSWCEGSLPDVMGQCLASQDRSAYCTEAGDAILTTRFGFEQCAERYDKIEGHYTRRYAKKHCALLYRTIAGRCADARQ